MQTEQDFLLLFTTSGDVLCSKSGGVWEALWIFSYEMDTWQMQENKQNSYCLQWCQSFILWYLDCEFGSVAYPGHPNKLTELYLWRFKLGISLSWLPCRHPNKTWHSEADISDCGDNYFIYFLNENLLHIQKQCICKLGKIQSELRLSFGVYWFLKLYTRIVWHSYFPRTGFHRGRAAACLGPSGLIRGFPAVIQHYPRWGQISLDPPAERHPSSAARRAASGGRNTATPAADRCGSEIPAKRQPG